MASEKGGGKIYEYEEKDNADEKAEGEKTEGETEGQCSVKDLFMEAEKKECVLLAVGLLFALVNGLGDPLMIVLFSESMSALSDPEDTLKVMSEVAILFVILGGILQVAASIQYGCFSRVAKTLSIRMRKKWMRSLLKQDIAYFDKNDASALPGKMSSTMVSFEEGIGAKLGLGLQFFSGFLAGVIIAFVYNAYVALITIAAMPLVAGSGAWLVKVNTEAAEKKDKCYSKANALAYETFKGLKTVLSVNGSGKMERRYMEATREAKKAGIGRSFHVGVANGSMLSTFNLMYLAITVFGGWALSHQIKKTGCDPSGSVWPRNKCDTFNLPREMDGTAVFIALMSLAIGGQALGQVAGSVDALSVARKAMKACVDVIKNEPEIDPEAEGGLKPSQEDTKGKLELEDIKFAYPTRPDAVVFDDFGLTIEPGQTLALVGESGSGKSTITQLLQRFYDPNQGRILLDGTDLKDLNVKWLRQNVGIVSQEPQLFTGTIAENIGYGATASGKEASLEDIQEAAKQANAHNFIMEFNKGYDTEVGFGGSQMSGGQKQRIAIARALVKKPTILLLDEATSALDNKSELVVQEALDKLVEGDKSNRTTIIIAHRLSTIRTADVIGYVEGGKIVEKGTHEELIKMEGGHYRELVEKQEVKAGIGMGSTTDGKADRTSMQGGEATGKASEGQDGNSTNEEADSKEGKEGEEKPEYKVSWKRIWECNKADTKFLTGGAFSAMIAGALYPFWGYMFAKMIVVFFTPVYACVDEATVGYFTAADLGFTSCKAYFDRQADKLWDDAVNLSYFWIGVAVLTLVSNALMFLGFGTASERLCFRIRNRMFSTYLRQEPGYFDAPENSVGSVSSRLASDATLLKAKTGEPLQQILITLFGCVGGIVLAAIFAWPIALMAIGVLPILGFAMTMQVEMILGQSKAGDSEDPKIGSLAGESLNSIRTVTAFGLQKSVAQRYDGMLVNLEMSTDALLRKSVGFGASFSLQHWAWALLMWFGAWVIDNLSFNFEDFSIAVFAFFFGLFGMSMAASGATDTKQAVNALTNIFQLLDRVTKIDPKSSAGVVLEEAKGEVEFKDVVFTYPAREDNLVCNQLSFSIGAGEKIGVVGSSGSGKSTIIQLIERFYDPDGGQAVFDQLIIQNLSYEWIHSRIGMVGQEPVLFNGTIASNIAFGHKADDLPREEIVAAAKLANADAFIMELPDGYETEVGPGGTLLSGGQKQRIAIARALVCKPKVLLLDEATSALDATSEQVVQEALNKLMNDTNMTTIMIAHRMSTVRDMDKILVIENGQVVEFGSHDDLMQRDEGVYAGLVRASGKQ
ncbi:ABC transporter [Chloropicon primus]|nr:ABC transporter [Chloropicon primus]